MTLLALLVSGDDSASDILGRVLPASGIAVERFSDLVTAIDRLHQQRFNALILDFEDPKAAAEVLEQARRLNFGNVPITVALVAERAGARDVLSGGAHFVLYKPLSEDRARAGLRAAAALLNRERRRAHRVPVQAPAELTLADTRKAEGILLDLSETGMEVLTAEPQANGALLKFRFQLPDGRSNRSPFSGSGRIHQAATSSLAAGRSGSPWCGTGGDRSPLQAHRSKPGRLLRGNRFAVSGARLGRPLPEG